MASEKQRPWGWRRLGTWMSFTIAGNKGEHEQPCEARLSKDERLGFVANENVDLDLGETNSQ